MLVEVYIEKFDDNFEPLTEDFINSILEGEEKFKKDDALMFTIEISLDDQKFDETFEIYMDDEKIITFVESDLDIINDIHQLLFDYIMENKTLDEIADEMPNDVKNILKEKISNEEQIWMKIKKSVIKKLIEEGE